jgi:hypothetical protein
VVFGLFAWGAAACAQPVRSVPAVYVAPPPRTAPVAEAGGTLLGECRIAGSGERAQGSLEDAPEFDVFASHDARQAALVVADTATAHVTWSRFPAIPQKDARAHVALGGQRHVRFGGWASLSGRTFSTARRMYAEPGHLWAHAGAPIEMMAAEGGVAIARVASPFVSPKTFLVRGACKGVVYEPEEPAHAKRPDRDAKESVLNRYASLDLFAAPKGRSFTTITFENQRSFVLDVLDRRDGFVRVAGDEGDVGFDAWVRAGQVTDDDSGFGTIGLSGYGTSSCGGMFSAYRGTLIRDEKLFVGDKPVELRGAVVEKDADILYRPGEAKTVGGHELVPFEFADRMIRAADGASMWVAKDAVASN